MLRLKKNVREFLKAHVKPNCLARSIENIEADASLHGCANHWRIVESQSIHGVRIDFDLSKDCFEEVEDLKPYKWYPREMYDGNPKSYLIIETHEGDWTDCYANEQSELIPETTHFMYIEPLEVTDED